MKVLFLLLTFFLVGGGIYEVLGRWPDRWPERFRRYAGLIGGLLATAAVLIANSR